MQHAAHEMLSAACSGVPQVKEDEQQAARLDAVFPCILKILPTCIFNKKDPIVLGVDVIEGIAKVRPGTTPYEQPAPCCRADSIVACIWRPQQVPCTVPCPCDASTCRAQML